ncbi:MAG: SPASM domain-containing protein [bacterium]
MPFRETRHNKEGLVGIGIDITERCSWDCPICFAVKTPRDMDFEVYQQIVDQGAILDFPELYILGGEPGMRSDILDILKHGTKKFPLVFFVTNMEIMAKEVMCQQIAEMGVIVAGQRHTMSDNEKSRQTECLLTGGDHLASNHAGWKNVEKYFPSDHICVQCCITQPVVKSGSIFEVFKWARANGYETVMEFTKEGQRFKRGCSLDVSPTEMIKTLEEFQRIEREELNLPGAKLLSPQTYDKTCHMQESSIHFQVTGQAIPCVGFPGLSYGNIMTSSLRQILDHPLREHVKNPKNWIYGYCSQECSYFEQCTGGCRGSAFDITGCYRSSFYYCPHIPHDKLNISDMIPRTCEGCPLEGNLTCNPKRNAKKLLYQQ